MVYARLSTLVPGPFLKELDKQLTYNSIAMDVQRFSGFLLIYAFFLGAGLAFNAYVFGFTHPAIAFALGFAGFLFLVYILLRLNSEAKGRAVEGILPDALRLIAANMKSGLTTERALFVASRDEFGALQIELRNASKRISSGVRVEDALNGIGERINSRELRKTVWLITQGIRSGGQMADLLLQLSEDLKNQNAIQEEIRSNISIYVLLILFSAVFGAPLLFGISSFIVQVLSKQLEAVPTLQAGEIPSSSNFGALSSFATGERSLVTTDFIVMFSMAMLLITTVFSSLTIGAINTGKEINGLKFVIPVMVAAFAVFFAVRAILTQFFGTLI